MLKILLMVKSPIFEYQKYDYSHILSFIESNAKLGHIGANLLLAIVYSCGLLGVKKNNEKVKSCLDVIYNSNDAWLQRNIGKCFEFGKIWNGNSDEALKWLLKSAENNLKIAQLDVSNFYRQQRDQKNSNIWKQKYDEKGEKLPSSPSYLEPEPSLPSSSNLKLTEKSEQKPKNIISKLNPFGYFNSSPSPSPVQQQYQLRVTENVIIAEALFDFTALNSSQLSVCAGEQVYVVKKHEDDSNKIGWWHCRNVKRQEGLIPHQFLKVLEQVTTSEVLQKIDYSESQTKSISVNELGPIIKSLGEGGFGVVQQRKWKNVDVAVKISKMADFASDEDKNAFQQEIDVMKLLNHPNIVNLLAIINDTNVPGLVVEFMNEGFRV